jgi:uncharacterized protein (TIGR02391 family)
MEPSDEYLIVMPHTQQEDIMCKSAFVIENMLHPVISQHAYPKFLSGHYRNSILDGLIAVFDLVRERTGLDLDGSELVGRVFSLSDPMLILSELDNESGRTDQKGFIQMLQGAYASMRNPRAHTITTEIDELSAAQCLVFASLLARRVELAITGNLLRFDGLYVDIAKTSDGFREYLRFYADGTVLKASLKISRDDLTDLPLIMNRLTRPSAEKFDFPRGRYIRNGNKLELGTEGQEDKVQYEGTIKRGDLDLFFNDYFRGVQGSSCYQFHRVELPTGYRNE